MSLAWIVILFSSAGNASNSSGAVMIYIDNIFYIKHRIDGIGRRIDVMPCVFLNCCVSYVFKNATYIVGAS